MALRRALLLALAALLVAPSARADGEKAECARSAEAAQRLRAEGKLQQAREALLACVKESCPQVVRADCATWLADVEASTPTIVLRAEDERAQDLGDVRASIDGRRVERAGFGRALPVDPGTHAVHFERAGTAPIEKTVVVAAGEKNRLVVAVFPSGAVVSVTPRTPGPPAGAWVFAAIALAAGASFATFGAIGQSEYNHLHDTCFGHCAEGDLDSAWTKLTVADISLVAGVVSAGIATWLFLAPRTPFYATPSPHGASFGVHARF